MTVFVHVAEQPLAATVVVSVNEPAAPAFRSAGFEPIEAAALSAGDRSPLVGLGRAFGLSAFDLDVILIALAPELDLRVGRGRGQRMIRRAMGDQAAPSYP